MCGTDVHLKCLQALMVGVKNLILDRNDKSCQIGKKCEMGYNDNNSDVGIANEDVDW